MCGALWVALHGMGTARAPLSLCCPQGCPSHPFPGTPAGRLGAPMAFRHIQGRVGEELREGECKKIKRKYLMPYLTSHSLCGSNAQHPQVHRLGTSQDDQCRAGHSPTSPSSGERCLGGGEDSAKHPLQSISLEDLASCWLLCPQFPLLAPSWFERAAPWMSPLCHAQASPPKLPLCKITISPPCSTLPHLPCTKTTSSRGSCGADAHQSFLYKRGKKYSAVFAIHGQKNVPYGKFPCDSHLCFG